MWYYCNSLYIRSQFNKKYKKYLTNDLTSLIKDNGVGRNILILCHGRNHYVAHIDLVDYQKDNIITIDVKQSANPHLLLDLSEKFCFKGIPDNSIDIIIFHSCGCCTSSVNHNYTLGSERCRVEVWINTTNSAIPIFNEEDYSEIGTCGTSTMPNVEQLDNNLTVVSPPYRDDFSTEVKRSEVIWLPTHFHFIEVLTSNNYEFIPELPSYDYYNRIVSRNGSNLPTLYVHIWRKRELPSFEPLIPSVTSSLDL